MKMIERNKTAEAAALLIHPMLSSAEGIELCVTDFWGDDVRCFLPDLSSHGEAAGETYHSASEEAKAIHDYLVEQNCTHLQLGFGASLGGVVLFELLKFEDLTFDHIFFEGVSFYERAPLLCFMLTRVFLSKHRKAVKDPELSRRKMSEIYGETAGPAMAKRFIAVNETSIRNIIHDCAYVDLPDFAPEMQKRCMFAYGEKDSDLKQCKKLLPAKYPEAKLEIWPGYAHCGRMTADSENYAAMLRRETHMKDKELQFDRTCHVLYSKPCKKEIRAKIALHYPEAEREAVWEKVQRQYVEFLSDWRTDLGGKQNFHNGAGGTYDCIAILSYYVACKAVTSFREIEEMEENLILPSFRRLKFVDCNKPFFKRLMYQAFTRAKALCDTWNDYEMAVAPFEKDKPIYYEFTACPAAEFAIKHGMTDIMPALCNVDFASMELIHARLVRTTTCANGCKCDYTICGDRDPYLKSHPEYRDEAGYRRNR